MSFTAGVARLAAEAITATPAPPARAMEGGRKRGATAGAGMTDASEDFAVEYYEGGRFRLRLDTSDAGKIPKFRQAIDCLERPYAADLPTTDRRRR
jgi:hypothetical protein